MSDVRIDAVWDALRQVQDPDLKRDLVTLGMIEDLAVAGDRASFTLVLTTAACPLKDEIEAECRRAVGAVPGVHQVEIRTISRVRKPKDPTAERRALPGVAHVIAIGSGKGGVGKSTVSANLAASLAASGARVGLLDGDIYGPNLPRMLGVRRQPMVRDGRVMPVEAWGLTFMSMGLLVDQGEAVVWRGPMLHGAIRSFLHDVDWGELDYLLVDLPPGTGDVQLSLIQQTHVGGAVVVTTPSTVAVEDAVKAVSMFKKLEVPVLGFIENMSYFLCPNCSTRHPIFASDDAESREKQLGVPFLGSIPLHPDVRDGGDHGRPVVLEKPEAEYSRALARIAGHLAQRISIQTLGAGDMKIYADHAATTPLAPEVLEAMRPYFGDSGFGNPSSVHGRGDAAREAVEQARVSLADLVGADPEEIVFTASGSESNNLAIKGLLAGAPEGRRRLVVSAIEHPSVLETARHLESRGVPVTVVPVDERGVVDEGRCAEALGPDVALLSIQWVNNETGTIQPIARLAERAHACGARVHCDAVQAAGKLPIEVAAAGVDLLSLAGHKFHGPLGAAALYVKRRVRLVPMVHGGHQERGRRAGTENLPAIVGLGAAAIRARQALADGTVERAARMGESLLGGLLEALPGSRLNGDRDRRVRSIVNLCVPGVDGEALLHELDRAGISISTGSACSAASPGPSHVLIAMGRTPEEAHASVRFSLGADHDEQIVQTIVRETPAAVARVRSLAGASRGRHAASGTP